VLSSRCSRLRLGDRTVFDGRAAGIDVSAVDGALVTPEKLLWELVEPLYADPKVTRSTMMGLPCVRLDGRFFASLDRRSGALLVKLSADRVRALIDAGHGQPFAPAGRVFREWVALPRPERRRRQALLAEARDRAATGASSI
jgi:hypothetical protein